MMMQQPMHQRRLIISCDEDNVICVWDDDRAQCIYAMSLCSMLRIHLLIPTPCSSCSSSPSSSSSCAASECYNSIMIMYEAENGSGCAVLDVNAHWRHEEMQRMRRLISMLRRIPSLHQSPLLYALTESEWMAITVVSFL